MARIYAFMDVPARSARSARMPRHSRINAGPLLGLALMASPWVLAAAVALF